MPKHPHHKETRVNNGPEDGIERTARRDDPVSTNKCPDCNYRLEAHAEISAPLSHAVPRAGDVSICFSCGCLLRFDSPEDMHKLTGEEFRALPIDLQIHILFIRDQLRILNMRRHETEN